MKGGRNRVEKKRKVIKSSKMAKELLSYGFIIIDIAPDKNDYKRTVFVFESTPEFEKVLNSIKEV
jgi:hypothetical protein